MLPKLYIYDSKGKEREWSVRTEGEKIIVSHGLVGGKIVEKVTKAKPKNVGKANATTAEEQAVLEAKSKWTKQVEREDYHEDIEKSGLQMRPMLAHDYNKVPHRVDWTQALAQPKLDGLRLTYGHRQALQEGTKEPLAYNSLWDQEMLTRKGETYNLPHLETHSRNLLQLVNDRCDGRCLALDGEAYLHGLPLQQITSRARKYRKGLTEELEYHLFDLVIPGMPFTDRWMLLEECLKNYNELRPGRLSLVPTFGLKDEEHMKLLHGNFIEAGYEGLMIRHEGSQYHIGQRSADLFKYKQFFDKECLITDVWEDKNGNAMLTCAFEKGNVESEFGCTPKRTHEERKRLLSIKDELIGKWITVKYQDITEDGLPTFPVGLDIRECDDEGNPIV